MMYVTVCSSLVLTTFSGPNYGASRVNFHSMLVSVADHKGKPAPDSGDIGARVSIRIHDEEPGKFRDLLGYLVEPTVVRDKNGILKTFEPDQIVAWKRLPERMME